MDKLRIRNWERFQHYRDRNPPWIKLHYELLSSHDWVMLADASRVLAVVCMLIASRNDGHVPNDPEYIKRVGYLSKTPDLKPLIQCGFLEPASGCKQMLADARPETETEAETETEQTRSSPTDERWLEFWSMYPRKVGRKRAESAFKNQTAANQKAALAALPKHMSMWETRSPDKIPHASTWISGARWEDDLDEGGVALSKPRRLYNPDTGEFDEVT